jgi:hypothetical protein
MPATPAKTGGAGTGSLKKAKTIPAANPVSIDSNTSFIAFHPLWEENSLRFYSFVHSYLKNTFQELLEFLQCT